MRTDVLSALAVACLIALAGCSGPGSAAAGTAPATDGAHAGGPASTDTSPSGPAVNGSATDGGAQSATASPTATPTPTPTATPTATPVPWTRPEPPNEPMEDKTDAEPWDRITAVEFVDTVPAENRSGYTDFDLRIHANTSMADVDPPSHGTVVGEPYFVVYVNDVYLERSGYVLQQDDGTFDVRVRASGLDRFEDDRLNVTVMLLDRDSQHDDIYGVWNGTVRYAPER